MQTDSEHFIQGMAFALVIVGLCACGMGDHWHLTTLANGGNTAVGLGGGILTGQKMQQMTTKGGGSIVNSSDPGK